MRDDLNQAVGSEGENPDSTGNEDVESQNNSEATEQSEEQNNTEESGESADSNC